MDVTIDPHAPPPPPGQDELPSDDGEPMDTPRHRAQMNLLIDSLDAAWAARDDYYVGGNMFVYFSELQSRGEKFRGPDVFVVLDTERRKVRKSWVAWQEGGRLPDVVIELFSPTTEDVDRGEKMRVYARIWRTGQYVLFDPETQVLEGYRLEGNKYVRIAPDAEGRLAIESMGLWLGLAPGTYAGEGGNWLRWLDANGRVLPTEGEEARARASEAQRQLREAEAKASEAEAKASEAAARARAAEERLAALEAELRRQR